MSNCSFRLFRKHSDFESLIAAAHRFRATDHAGFYSLAKDLARLTADSIDTAAVQTIVQPPEGEEWGSLKSLEELLALKVTADLALTLVAPLVGICALRHADAHLPSSEIDEAFALARVNRTQPFIFQGDALLDSCVSSLYAIFDFLKSPPVQPQGVTTV